MEVKGATNHGTIVRHKRDNMTFLRNALVSAKGVARGACMAIARKIPEEDTVFGVGLEKWFK